MQARARWGIAKDDMVVLFVGRLSLHAKANPWPMYLACAKAAKETGRRVLLIECGWFANEAIRACFEEAAGLTGAEVMRVDGRDPEITRQTYAAADIFMSLSDNIQETFGLTPVEAMAAGLPVIVSDWDGYRETVRHEVDGFLIPTTQAAESTAGQSTSEGYEDGRLNYDHYIAQAHLLVAVDVQACSRALVQLIQEPGLRHRMGEAGRQRARDKFDWSVIMTQYQELWGLQLKARQSAQTHEQPRVAQRDPAFTNFLDLFDHYPSRPLKASAKIWRPPEMTAHQLARIRNLGMWGFSQDRLASASALTDAWGKLPTNASAACDLSSWAEILGWTPDHAIRQASWLLKIGALNMLDERDN